MQRQQTLSVTIRTPSLGWKFEFISVHEDKAKIIAVAKISGGSAADAIDHKQATLEIDQTGLYAKPVKYYVLTDKDLSRWWLQSKSFTAINSLDAIKNVTANMELMYSVEEYELTSAPTVYKKG